MHAWAWWFGVVAALAGARELDPAACSPRFDVQRDKIIRTEESREMGARYLSELDVGSRAECLRLCCETDSCDVFVYEERSPGSCYLFNCGPPEDFRCKFTAHSNFSSGVMAISRRLAELQDQERLAQHERDLNNLRSVTSSTIGTTTLTTPAPAAAVRVQRPPQPPHPPQHAQSPNRRCSRYQFECHNGGECIAVYNACDGVPQCADGSDEAPELDCPSAPPLQVAHTTPSTTTATTQKISQKHERVEILNTNSNLISMQGVVAEGDHWPHRLTQAQPPRRYNEPASPRFFNHKGGIVLESDSSALGSGNAVAAPGQFQPYEPPPWQRRPWQSSGGLENIAEEQPWSGYARPVSMDWPAPDPRRVWPVPQPRPDQDMNVYMPQKTMPEIPMAYSSQQQTLRDSPKKGFDLVDTIKKPEEIATPSPPQVDIRVDHRKDKQSQEKEKGNETPKTVIKDNVTPANEVKAANPEKHSATHEHFTAMDEHDGLSEHPPAAVLLLVLGILMTAAMGAMLGCRARAVRRRLRRGGKSFAHDADYLVNGMYL